MFTGLVEETGIVERLEPQGQGAHIHIAASVVTDGLRLGDSVAVNGACLTVVRLTGRGFAADAVPETLRRTNLGRLRPGSRVNLERALRLGDRLGGHLVSGHVDAVGTLSRQQPEGSAVVLTYQVPRALMRYIAPKGSICVDGVSLTVMDVAGDSFRVSVIPHTAAHTTLLDGPLGKLVNLETDVIAKYVERLLLERGSLNAPGGVEAGHAGSDPPDTGSSGQGLTHELLARYGFA
ncbi:MAG: riboflavin synthase [Alicyclobacillaceae bacterium]|nr:riboflavin synthase [Alicyclobacillaceae bacterium]